MLFNMYKLVIMVVIVAVTTAYDANDRPFPDNVLDGNSFLIYNKEYSQARLAQKGENSGDVGTNEKVGGLAYDQMWELEKVTNDKDDCTGYYISNLKHRNFRLAVNKHHQVYITNRNREKDQRFKFFFKGPNYYIIHCDTWLRLEKKSNDDSVGVSRWYGGPYTPEQVWTLVPRFEAKIRIENVVQFDNRHASTPIERTERVTEGMTTTASSEVSKTESFKKSIEASATAAFWSVEVSTTLTAEINSEITKAFSKSTTESWSSTIETKFTIPARKNYKVMQAVVDFNSDIKSDNTKVYTKTTICESDDDKFSCDAKYFFNVVGE